MGHPVLFTLSLRDHLRLQHPPVLPIVGSEKEGVEDWAGVAEEHDQSRVPRKTVQELAVAVEVAHTQPGTSYCLVNISFNKKALK